MTRGAATLALVLLLLLWAPIAAYAAATDLFAYTPTGDELYDTYMNALIEQSSLEVNYFEALVKAQTEYYGVTDLTGGLDAVNKRIDEARGGNDWPKPAPWADIAKKYYGLPDLPSRLPVELVQGWQPRFASDPRYYQLLAYCARGSKGYDVLVDAYLHHHADAVTFLRLQPLYTFAASDYVSRRLKEQDKKRADYAQSVEEAKAAGEDPPTDDTRYRTKEQLEHSQSLARKQIKRLGIKTELGLLTKAIAADPDWAQMYYARAGYYYEHGEYEKAIADLEAGNAATKNLEPWPFPISALVAETERNGNVIAQFWGEDEATWDDWPTFTGYAPAVIESDNGEYWPDLPQDQRVSLALALLHENARAMLAARLDGFDIINMLSQMQDLLIIVQDDEIKHHRSRLRDAPLALRIGLASLKALRRLDKQSDYEIPPFAAVNAEEYSEHLQTIDGMCAKRLQRQIALREELRPLLEQLAAYDG